MFAYPPRRGVGKCTLKILHCIHSLSIKPNYLGRTIPGTTTSCFPGKPYRRRGACCSWQCVFRARKNDRPIRWVDTTKPWTRVNTRTPAVTTNGDRERQAAAAAEFLMTRQQMKILRVHNAIVTKTKISTRVDRKTVRCSMTENVLLLSPR